MIVFEYGCCCCDDGIFFNFFFFSFFPSTVYSKMKNEQRSKTQAKEMKLFSRYTRPITFVIFNSFLAVPIRHQWFSRNLNNFAPQLI